MKILVLLAVGFFSLTLHAKTNAKNVIYFIGDGMGPTQITGARMYKNGPNSSLNMERMKVTGFSKTWCSDEYSTDSAAAGTALATGVKTYSGSIGVSDPNFDPTGKSRDLETLVDLAKKLGKSVGIITTARVTHATPAVFYAHAKSRKMEAEIALQLLDSNVDLVLGGGRSFFLGTNRLDHESGEKTERKDEKDLLAEAGKKGWSVALSTRELGKLGPAHKKKILGLFEYSHMKYEIDRSKDVLGEPSVKEMTDFAIKYLSKNPKGYFLMIEGARIDHASHGNQAMRTFTEVIAMDDAVGLALKQNQNETLVVVTADHETGGLSISGYGPQKAGTGNQMLKNLKLGEDEKLNHGIIAWASGPGYNSSYKADDENNDHQHKATYFLDSAAHTAVDVPILANGPGSWMFTGYMNNTEIPVKIARSMGTKFSNKVNQQNRNALKL